MNPKTYFLSLKTEEKESFAIKAGTTVKYMKAHLFQLGRDFPTRFSSPKVVVGISEGSEGNVSLDEAIEYFLVQPVKQLAEESDTTLPKPANTASYSDNAHQVEMMT